MQQCAPIAGLILGAGLGLNARMSTDSNEQQSGEQAGDDCAKTIPRLVLIRDVLCAGNTKRLAEHLDLSLPSTYRIMREGIPRRAARRLEAKIGLPVDSIYSAVDQVEFAELVQAALERQVAQGVAEPQEGYAAPSIYQFDLSRTLSHLLFSDPEKKLAAQFVLAPPSWHTQLPEPCQLAISVLMQEAASHSGLQANPPPPSNEPKAPTTN